MSARKSAAYYEVDIPNCHTGFVYVFPPPLFYRALKHVCGPGNASTFGYLIAISFDGIQVQRMGGHIWQPLSRRRNLAADGALIATAFTSHECAYCLSPIVSGQRWVREKIYEPSPAKDPRYRRYHADLFVEQELSCWEKHEMELELARTAVRIM